MSTPSMIEPGGRRIRRSLAVRWAAIAIACGLALLCGCESRTGTGHGERRKPTPEELVHAWARPKNRVSRYSLVRVPGYELYWVKSANHVRPPTGFGVAVPIDGDNFLEGKGALQTLLDKGVDDPLDVARLTMLFYERGGVPLERPRSEVHRTAGVSAPRVQDDVLTYFYERRSFRHIEVLRGELDLDTLRLSTRSVHVQETHP